MNNRIKLILITLFCMLFPSILLAETTIDVDGDISDWASSDAQCVLNEVTPAGSSFVDMVEMCMTDDASTDGYLYVYIEFDRTSGNSTWLKNADVYMNIDYDGDGITDYTLDYKDDPANEIYGIISLPYLELKIDYDLVDPDGDGIFYFNIESAWRSSPEDNLPSNPDDFIHYVKDPDTLSPRSVNMLWMAATLFNYGVKLQWTTATERKNAGFNIYRSDSKNRGLILLNKKPIPGLGDAPFGKTYSFKDRNGLSNSQYYIEDIDFNGKTKLRGPINAEITENNISDILKNLIPKSDRPYDIIKRIRRFFRNSQYNERKVSNPSALKFKIDSEAFHLIAREELEIKKIFTSLKQLSVKVDGVKVPTISNKNGLYFYANPKKDRYADFSVATVEKGNNAKIRTVKTGGCDNPLTSSDTTEVFEENNNYYVATPSMDPFFWNYSYVGYPASLNFDLNNPASKDGTIEIFLAGFATGVTGPDHIAQFYLNGQYLGESAFEGTDLQKFSFDVENNLNETNNVFEVVLKDDGIIDMLIIDKLRVTYKQKLKADTNAFSFDALSGACLQIESDILHPVIFDVTNPLRPKKLKGFDKSGGVITFLTNNRSVKKSGGLRKYLLTSKDLAETAEPMGLKQDKIIRSYPDYLVITHPLFIDAAQKMADFHSRNGLKSSVITTTQIYDNLSNSRPDPEAIKALLANSKKILGAVPVYVLLMGGATVDSNDNLGQGDEDFIPAPFYKTLLKGYEAPDDGWYTEGTSIAIGRLPVDDSDDAVNVVEKIITFNDNLEQSGTSLFIADKDPENTFENSCEKQITYLDSFQDNALRMYLNDGAKAADLNDTINAGIDVLNYHGHAYLSGWSAGPQLANIAFADSLANDRLFTLLSWSCFDGSFVGPWDDSLAWEYVKNPDGGASVALAGGSLSDPSAVNLLSQLITDELASKNCATIGIALVNAEKRLKEIIGISRAQDTVSTFNILGDPANPNPYN